jgi:TRAP transporter 4TM/12TM fusion protein
LLCIVVFIIAILYMAGILATGRQIIFLIVPLLTSLYFLSAYVRRGSLYPRLGRKLNVALLFTFVGIPLLAGVRFFLEYFTTQYYAWYEFSPLDLALAALVLLLVFEYARREQVVLFWLAVVFMIYSLPQVGKLLPEPFFHLGLPYLRLITSNTLEASGAFGDLPGIALYYVIPMLFLLDIVAGFGVLRSLGEVVLRYVRRRRLLPPACILSSAAIGVTTASITANVTVAGSFTIPTYRALGFPPDVAGSIEVASSVGGLILPPIMSVAAFVMAGMMGVSYWDVAMHAWIIGIIYFIALIVCVDLYGRRVLASTPSPQPELKASGEGRPIEKTTFLYLGGFILTLAVVIIYLGALQFEIPTAAFYGLITMLPYFLLIKVYEGLKHGLKRSLADYLKSILNGIEEGAVDACNVALLLAVLGIVVNVMTVVGFLADVSWLLAGIASASPSLLVIAAFFFGIVVGLGLPPSATYVLMAVTFVPLMISAGFNLWSAHFFVFLVACLAEFSPPASIGAAAAARMSGGSFYKVMLISSFLALPIWLFPFIVLLYPQVLTLTAEGALYGFITLSACLGLTARLLLIKQRMSRASSILLLACIILGAIALAFANLTIQLISAILIWLLLIASAKKL